jgi:hypothetical protein
MKYLCLISADTLMEQMPPAQAEKLFEEYREFTEQIRKSRHFISVNRLQLPDTAKTVRVRNGQVLTTDGPFTETKEHLGGYYLIQARDMNEATQIAARIPGAKLGSVEVRPIAEDAPTRRALGIRTFVTFIAALISTPLLVGCAKGNGSISRRECCNLSSPSDEPAINRDSSSLRQLGAAVGGRVGAGRRLAPVAWAQS